MKKDPFDDLDSLRLTPEMMAQSWFKPKPEGGSPPSGQRRKRLARSFYLVSEDWFDHAAAATKTAKQLQVAVRLYRMWLMRPVDTPHIVASNQTLRATRPLKLRTLTHLRKAKLIHVERCGKRQAPLVTVCG
jgi:hypothetical protein